MANIGLWQNRDFAPFWVGQTISKFGSYIGGAGVGGPAANYSTIFRCF
jgi:hypothetical protein